MKPITRILSLALLAAAAVGSPGIQREESRDIVNTALTVHKFNTFLELLRDADLVFTLKQPGPYTVLIPTNEAFERAYSPERLRALRGNKGSLRRLLMRHVIRGAIDAERLAKSGWIEPLAGEPLRTQIVEGRGTVNGARFAIPNVRTSNGFIHGIDRVIGG